MSEVSQILDTLEVNLFKALRQIEALKEENSRLAKELENHKRNAEKRQADITAWEERFESLKMANSILGSSESATQAKLKINTLIREIDHCIAQLSE